MCCLGAALGKRRQHLRMNRGPVEISVIKAQSSHRLRSLWARISKKLSPDIRPAEPRSVANDRRGEKSLPGGLHHRGSLDV